MNSSGCIETPGGYSYRPGIDVLEPIPDEAAVMLIGVTGFVAARVIEHETRGLCMKFEEANHDVQTNVYGMPP